MTAAAKQEVPIVPETTGPHAWEKIVGAQPALAPAWLLNPIPAPRSILALAEPNPQPEDDPSENQGGCGFYQPPPPGAQSARIHILNRARKYLSGAHPSISGQGGHAAAFHAACAAVHGFKLSNAEAFDVLSTDFNPRCLPAWSDCELRHKVLSARKDGAYHDLLSQEPTNKAMPSFSLPKSGPLPKPCPQVVPFHSIGGNDLMKKVFDPIKWAVEPLLPEGCFLLAGRPKSGKSWLLLNIAVAVATGGVALGKIEVEPGPVLYLALEDTLRRLQERIKLILNGHAANLHNLTAVTLCPRQGNGGLEEIQRWHDKNPTGRLVIVDTLAMFRPKTKAGANSYEEDYAAIHPLKALADQRGFCAGFNHHTRKLFSPDPQDAISGTLGLAGAADTTLVLLRQPKSDDAELHIKGRDVDDKAHALRWDNATHTWQLQGEVQPKESISPERADILKALAKENKPLQVKDIAARLFKKPGAISKALNRMIEAGQVKLASFGRYVLNKPPVDGVEAVEVVQPFPPLDPPEEHSTFPTD